MSIPDAEHKINLTNLGLGELDDVDKRPCYYTKTEPGKAWKRVWNSLKDFRNTLANADTVAPQRAFEGALWPQYSNRNAVFSWIKLPETNIAKSKNPLDFFSANSTSLADQTGTSLTNKIIKEHTVLNTYFERKYWPEYINNYFYMAYWQCSYDYLMGLLRLQCRSDAMDVYEKIKDNLGESATQIKADMKEKRLSTLFNALLKSDQEHGLMNKLTMLDWQKLGLSEGKYVIAFHTLYMVKMTHYMVYKTSEQVVRETIDQSAITFQNISNEVRKKTNVLGVENVKKLLEAIPDFNEYFPGYTSSEATIPTIQDRNKLLYLGPYISKIDQHVKLLENVVVPVLDKENDQFDKLRVQNLKDRFNSYNEVFSIDIDRYRTDETYRRAYKNSIDRAKKYLEKSLSDEIDKKNKHVFKDVIAASQYEKRYKDLSESQRNAVDKTVSNLAEKAKYKSYFGKNFWQFNLITLGIKESLISEHIKTKIETVSNKEREELVKIQKYIVEHQPADEPEFCKKNKEKCLNGQTIRDTFLDYFGLTEQYKELMTKFKEEYDKNPVETMAQLRQNYYFKNSFIVKLPPTLDDVERRINSGTIETSRKEEDAKVLENLQKLADKTNTSGDTEKYKDIEKLLQNTKTAIVPYNPSTGSYFSNWFKGFSKPTVTSTATYVPSYSPAPRTDGKSWGNLALDTAYGVKNVAGNVAWGLGQGLKGAWGILKAPTTLMGKIMSSGASQFLWNNRDLVGTFGQVGAAAVLATIQHKIGISNSNSNSTEIEVYGK